MTRSHIDGLIEEILYEAYTPVRMHAQARLGLRAMLERHAYSLGEPQPAPTAAPCRWNRRFEDGEWIHDNPTVGATETCFCSPAPETPQPARKDKPDLVGVHLHRCPECDVEHWDRQPKPGEVHADDCICPDCGYGL